MAATIRAEFQNVGLVLAQLKGVDERVRKKALRKVASSASSRLAKAAKGGVPRRKPASIPKHWGYDGQQLRRSIGRKVEQYGGTAVGVVGARLGFRIQVGETTRDGAKNKAGTPVFVNPVKYLHLVLLGTARGRGVNFLDRARVREAGAIADDAARIVDAAIGGAG